MQKQHITRNNNISRAKLDSAFCKVDCAVCAHQNLGRDGALVESITFNRRVVGSTPAVAVT